MKKGKVYQQLGSKLKLNVFLGSKLTRKFLEDLENDSEKFYIAKLREAYDNTIMVTDIELSTEEKTVLNLLKGMTNNLNLKEETIINNNIILIFSDKDTEYIIVLNRYMKTYDINNKITQEIQNIYEYVDKHIKEQKTNVDLKINKKKDVVVGSYGLSSALGDVIATKYNAHHIAFNPVLLKTFATVYKIRGNPLSLFAYNPVRDKTFEIIKSYNTLDNKANDINNF